MPNRRDILRPLIPAPAGASFLFLQIAYTGLLRHYANG
jgi:hypothetical protein